jgi:hypothetical protein
VKVSDSRSQRVSMYPAVAASLPKTDASAAANATTPTTIAAVQPRSPDQTPRIVRREPVTATAPARSMRSRIGPAPAETAVTSAPSMAAIAAYPNATRSSNTAKIATTPSSPRRSES